MTDPIRVAIFGASGRMGQALLRGTVATPSLHLVAALVRADSVHAQQQIACLHGTAAASLRFASTLSAATDVLIDFSSAAAFDYALAIALEHRLAFVSGTTGLSTAQQRALRDAAGQIPVLWSANFSLGIAMLTRLARTAARALPEWDCEISEAHHRHKRDAPSGTALALGEAIVQARGRNLEQSATHDRSAAGPRQPGEIGFAVVRGGDIVGEHSVFLIGEGERIELTHRAQSRSIFAAGAVRAASWLAKRAPGFYTIEDVLGASD